MTTAAALPVAVTDGDVAGEAAVDEGEVAARPDSAAFVWHDESAVSGLDEGEEAEAAPEEEKEPGFGCRQRRHKTNKKAGC